MLEQIVRLLNEGISVRIDRDDWVAKKCVRITFYNMNNGHNSGSLITMGELLTKWEYWFERLEKSVKDTDNLLTGNSKKI